MVRDSIESVDDIAPGWNDHLLVISHIFCTSFNHQEDQFLPLSPVFKNVIPALFSGCISSVSTKSDEDIVPLGKLPCGRDSMITSFGHCGCCLQNISHGAHCDLPVSAELNFM